MVGETLANAPLVYTIGVFRFPRVGQSTLPGLLDGFQETIATVGYPTREDVPAQMVSATFGPAGFQIEQQTASVTQFRSADGTWAFILTDQVFCLHTAAYVHGQDFVQRFRAGLEALSDIEVSGIETAVSIGIRYVDLIVPREGDALGDYLRSWVMPLERPVLYDGSMLEVKGSMYVVACRSDLGDFRFQALRNPPTTVPPDLDTPLLQKNGWRPEIPAVADFAVLDSDHGCLFEAGTPFVVGEIAERLSALCGTVESWFLAAATEHAIEVWRGS